MYIVHRVFLFPFQFENLMRPIVMWTCFGFISLIALCIQMIIETYFKVCGAACFILLIAQLFKFVEFSDSLDECNNKILSMLCSDSRWYLRERGLQKMIQLVILRCQKSGHYSFHGGFITFNRPLVLSMQRTIYTFVNWLFHIH